MSFLADIVSLSLALAGCVVMVTLVVCRIIQDRNNDSLHTVVTITFCSAAAVQLAIRAGLYGREAYTTMDNFATSVEMLIEGCLVAYLISQQVNRWLALGQAMVIGLSCLVLVIVTFRDVHPGEVKAHHKIYVAVDALVVILLAGILYFGRDQYFSWNDPRPAASRPSFVGWMPCCITILLLIILRILTIARLVVAVFDYEHWTDELQEIGILNALDETFPVLLVGLCVFAYPHEDRDGYHCLPENVNHPSINDEDKSTLEHECFGSSPQHRLFFGGPRFSGVRASPA